MKKKVSKAPPWIMATKWRKKCKGERFSARWRKISFIFGLGCVVRVFPHRNRKRSAVLKLEISRKWRHLVCCCATFVVKSQNKMMRAAARRFDEKWRTYRPCSIGDLESFFFLVHTEPKANQTSSSMNEAFNFYYQNLFSISEFDTGVACKRYTV